jgi:DNA-binding NtrC family response regulator
MTDVSGDPSGSAVSRKRVLIVDDEPLLRRSFSRCLRPVHQVVEAENGQEAREILSGDRRFDAILCDITMPELDGCELYEWLVDHVPELAPRFILMSGVASVERASDLVQQHGVPMLEKPAAKGALLAAIAGVTGPG